MKFKWTKTEQEVFKEIKRIMASNVSFDYPGFNAEFNIHTDASKLQLVSVFSQDGKHITL